jgi:hypothetical protein
MLYFRKTPCYSGDFNEYIGKIVLGHLDKMAYIKDDSDCRMILYQWS